MREPSGESSLAFRVSMNRRESFELSTISTFQSLGQAQCCTTSGDVLGSCAQRFSRPPSQASWLRRTPKTNLPPIFYNASPRNRPRPTVTNHLATALAERRSRHERQRRHRAETMELLQRPSRRWTVVPGLHRAAHLSALPQDDGRADQATVQPQEH